MFTPHLLPVRRGILETIHLPLAESIEQPALAWVEDYADEPFVEVMQERAPSLADVVGTNRVAIGIFSVQNTRTPMLTLIAAIDNLHKGAAGQACAEPEPDDGLARDGGIAVSAGVRVIKVGGNQVEDPDWVGELARAVARSSRPTVLVHGGGREISALQRALGAEPEWRDGLRVTGTEGMRIVSMVLSGLVNKRLVAALLGAEVDALGISGEGWWAAPRPPRARWRARPHGRDRGGPPPRCFASGWLRALPPSFRRFPAVPRAEPLNVNADDAGRRSRHCNRCSGAAAGLRRGRGAVRGAGAFRNRQHRDRSVDCQRWGCGRDGAEAARRRPRRDSGGEGADRQCRDADGSDNGNQCAGLPYARAGIVTEKQ